MMLIGCRKSEYAKITDNMKLPPILILHGLEDHVIDWEGAKESYKDFSSRKEVTMRILDKMDHSMN